MHSYRQAAIMVRPAISGHGSPDRYSGGTTAVAPCVADDLTRKTMHCQLVLAHTILPLNRCGAVRQTSRHHLPQVGIQVGIHYCFWISHSSSFFSQINYITCHFSSFYQILDRSNDKKKNGTCILATRCSRAAPLTGGEADGMGDLTQLRAA